MKDETLQAAYRRVFLNKDGAIVLTDLASACYAFANMVDFSRPDRVYYNEGLRNVFLMILERMGISTISNIINAIQQAKLDDDYLDMQTHFGEEA